MRFYFFKILLNVILRGFKNTQHITHIFSLITFFYNLLIEKKNLLFLISRTIIKTCSLHFQIHMSVAAGVAGCSYNLWIHRGETKFVLLKCKCKKLQSIQKASPDI